MFKSKKAKALKKSVLKTEKKELKVKAEATVKSDNAINNTGNVNFTEG